jgi:hypothetical protein
MSGSCDWLGGSARSNLGFRNPASTRRGGAPCCTRELVHPPSDGPGGSSTATTVDDLVVRGRLLTSTILSGTVTVNGAGTPDPMYETGLCVRTGARIDGLSQHRALRVVEDSCMYGPLSVGTIYGPLAITQNPALAPVSGPILSVLGGTFMDSLAVLDEFSVNGVDFGPLATSRLLTKVAAATVTCVKGTDVRLGAIIDALGIQVVLTVLTGSLTYSLTDIIYVTLQQPGGGYVSTTAEVIRVMPSFNLALLSVDNGAFAGASILPLVAPEEDSPPQGTMVVVGVTSNSGDSVFAQSGIVANSHVQYFDYYTSHSVVLTQPTASAALIQFGNPIVDYAGRLISLQQGSYCIKARYIQHFIRLAEDSAYETVSVPYSYIAPTNASPARAIGLVERAGVSPPLLVGGISVAAGANPGPLVATSASTQLMSVTISVNGTPVSTPLGFNGQNNPSYTDTLVAAFLTSTTGVPTTVDVFLADGTSSLLTLTGAFMTQASSWADILPINLPGSGKPQPSTTFTYAMQQYGAQSISNITYNVTTTPTAGLFWAVQYGNGSDVKGHDDVIVAWGDKTALNDYMLNVNGFVKPSWASAFATVSPSWTFILTVGVIDVTTSPPSIAFTFKQLTIFTSFNISVAYDGTDAISAQINSGPLQTGTINSNLPLTCFSVVTNQTSGTATSTFGIASALSSLTVRAGTPTTQTLASTVAGPTAI